MLEVENKDAAILLKADTTKHPRKLDCLTE
jgi:hypothetical protein